ncbi:unnamed protein product [Arctogadus glacialis]
MEEQMSGIWCPCQKGGERGMEKDGVPFEQQAWRKSSRPQSEPCQRGDANKKGSMAGPGLGGAAAGVQRGREREVRRRETEREGERVLSLLAVDSEGKDGLKATLLIIPALGSPRGEEHPHRREASSPQHLPPQVPGRPRPQRSELIVPPCVL